MAQNRKTKPPTMTDVAKHAGVSQTLVSFIVNNNEAVSIPEETRERVLVAIKELGYRPNAAARQISTNKSGLIGFITDEIATTPFAGRVIKGAQESAWDHGKNLIVVNTDSRKDIELNAIETMLEWRVAGIIFATWYHRQVVLPENIHEVSTVLVNCFDKDHSLPSVVPDEVKGGFDATSILIQKGHHRIGFLNEIAEVPAKLGRLEGYRQALTDHGLMVDEELIIYAKGEPGGGYDGTMSLMKKLDPPTALFCYNDRMAMGAYDALRKLNLRIPEDVAVMGFDNQEMIAANLHPGLNTMELPHYQMGQWAIRFLVESIEATTMVEPFQQKIECPYIKRESI